MKKQLCKSMFVRILALSLAACMAFPGTAFAAAAESDPQYVEENSIEEEEITSSANEDESFDENVEEAASEEISLPEEEAGNEAGNDSAIIDDEAETEEDDASGDVIEEAEQVDDAADTPADEETEEDSPEEYVTPSDSDSAAQEENDSPDGETAEEPSDDIYTGGEVVSTPAVDSVEEEDADGQCTLLLDLDGGSWTDSYYEEQFGNGYSAEKGSYVYLPYSYDVEKNGYKFLGWTTTKGGTDVLESSSYTLESDVTLYAKWEKLTGLKLDLNGGSWTDSYYEERYGNGYYSEKGTTVYLPSSYNVERTGYKFLGWTKTKNGTDILESSNYTLESDVTFYAKWEKLYTVKFNANGGKWTSSYYEEYYGKGYSDVKNATTYLPSDYAISRSGYKCTGWTVEKNTGTVLTGNYKITKDITLYAKWEKLYTVKFNVNGGKWTDTYYKDGFTDIKNATRYLPSAYAISRSGYIFKGWTVEKNKGTVLTGDYKITKDITLYARWAQAVKVTLNAGKGYFGSNKKTTKMTLEVEKGLTVGTIYYDIYDENVPQNGTYAFDGWYKDSKFTKPVKRSDVLSANITYYAKWQTKTYKITVTNLKGAGYQNRATGKYVSSYDSTAASYSFYIPRGDTIGYISAWKDNQEGRLYFDKACKEKPYYSSYIPTGNTTVYAKFLNEVAISWNANGGATSYGSKTGVYSCTKNLMWENRPYVIRAGYYFVGWVDAAKPSVVLPASHVFSKNTSVKAKWAKGIKVTFNPNGGKWYSSDAKSTNKVYYTKAKAALGKFIDYPSTPVKSGYTFMGWKSSLTKKKVNNISTDKPAKAVTYTAIWSKNSIKVTLMAVEGSIYDDAKSKYVTKVTVSVPKNAKLSDVSLKYDSHDEPSKRLDFNGWSLKKNGTVLAGSYKFTKAVTLYPIWSKTSSLRVALVTNGGAIDGHPYNDPDVWHVKKGSTMTLPTGSHIEREGYTLVGWYTDYKCTKKVSNPAKYKVTKSCYLFAKWKKK